MNLFNFLSSSAILTVIDEGGLTNIELSGIDGLVKIIIEFFIPLQTKCIRGQKRHISGQSYT